MSASSGCTLAELKALPRVAAIAGGGRKVAAIKGALSGGYIDVLITDQFTAEKLLEDVAEPVETVSIGGQA